MKMDSYQKLAARTLPADPPWQDRAVNAALGLTGEAAAANVGKLRARYPDGFAADRSRDRD